MRKQGVNDPACRCNRRPALRAWGSFTPCLHVLVVLQQPANIVATTLAATGRDRAEA